MPLLIVPNDTFKKTASTINTKWSVATHDSLAYGNRRPIYMYNKAVQVMAISKLQLKNE